MRERKWIIVSAVVIAVLAAAVFTFARTPQYRATAVMLRQQTNLEQSLLSTTVFQLDDVQRDLVTMAQSVASSKVAALVRRELSSSKSAGTLLRMISTAPSSDSNNISVTASGADPVEVADVANSFVKQTILLRQESNKEAIVNAREVLENQLAGMSATDRKTTNGVELQSQVQQLRLLERMQTGGYVLWQPAQASGVPFSPQPVRDMGVALVLGLILGLIFAFVIDRLDRRIKRESDFELAFGLPVLASIPQVGRKWKGRDRTNASGFVGFKDLHSPMIEAYRSLRSNLQYFEVDRDLRKLLIVSGLPQEGKTATAANLALSLALSGKRVILVDTDLRNPMMHHYLDLGNETGLSSVLAGAVEVSEALRTVQLEKFLPPDAALPGKDNRRGPGEAILQKDLLCMTSGPLPPNPAELLSSSKMADILTGLGSLADYVLLDSPPVLLVADALTIAPRVDGVIVVARTNSTLSDEAANTRTALDRVGARLIGVVVGGVKANKRHGYQYSYYSSADELTF